MTKQPIRCRSTQLNLFRPRPKVPTWRALPVEVKKRVSSLLARMLREHQAGRLEVRNGRAVRDE